MTGVRTWLRTHRWTLLVLVALAAASVWASFSVDWARYQNGNPTLVQDVPAGKQVTYGGGVFELVDATVLAGDSDDGRTYGVSEGTDVVVVDLRVTPRADGDPEDYLACEVRLLAPSPAGQREWWPQSSNPTTYPDGDPDVFGCNVAGGPPYELRQFFVVPAGGAKDRVVQVVIQEELPLALHLH